MNLAMDTGTELKAKKFPLWATFLILLVLLSYAGVYAFGIAVIQTAQRLARELVDPDNIRMAAASIGQMPDSLPDGYSYRVGMSVNEEEVKKWLGLASSPQRLKELSKTGFNFIAVEHSPDGQQVVIVSSPQEEPKNAKEILKATSELGINAGRPNAHFKEIEKQGELEIAGERMAYISGEAEDATGNKMQGLIGCIVPRNSHRTITVYGLQSDGKAYNLEETLKLLSCIKSFSPLKLSN